MVLYHTASTWTTGEGKAINMFIFIFVFSIVCVLAVTPRIKTFNRSIARKTQEKEVE